MPRSQKGLRRQISRTMEDSFGGDTFWNNDDPWASSPAGRDKRNRQSRQKRSETRDAEKLETIFSGHDEVATRDLEDRSKGSIGSIGSTSRGSRESKGSSKSSSSRRRRPGDKGRSRDRVSSSSRGVPSSSGQRNGVPFHNNRHLTGILRSPRMSDISNSSAKLKTSSGSVLDSFLSTEMPPIKSIETDETSQKSARRRALRKSRASTSPKGGEDKEPMPEELVELMKSLAGRNTLNHQTAQALQSTIHKLESVVESAEDPRGRQSICGERSIRSGRSKSRGRDSRARGKSAGRSYSRGRSKSRPRDSIAKDMNRSKSMGRAVRDRSKSRPRDQEEQAKSKTFNHRNRGKSRTRERDRSKSRERSSQKHGGVQRRESMSKGTSRSKQEQGKHSYSDGLNSSSPRVRSKSIGRASESTSQSKAKPRSSRTKDYESSPVSGRDKKSLDRSRSRARVPSRGSKSNIDERGDSRRSKDESPRNGSDSLRVSRSNRTNRFKKPPLPKPSPQEAPARTLDTALNFDSPRRSKSGSSVMSEGWISKSPPTKTPSDSSLQRSGHKGEGKARRRASVATMEKPLSNHSQSGRKVKKGTAKSKRRNPTSAEQSSDESAFENLQSSDLEPNTTISLKGSQSSVITDEKSALDGKAKAGKSNEGETHSGSKRSSDNDQQSEEKSRWRERKTDDQQSPEDLPKRPPRDRQLDHSGSGKTSSKEKKLSKEAVIPSKTRDVVESHSFSDSVGQLPTEKTVTQSPAVMEEERKASNEQEGKVSMTERQTTVGREKRLNGGTGHETRSSKSKSKAARRGSEENVNVVKGREVQRRESAEDIARRTSEEELNLVDYNEKDIFSSYCWSMTQQDPRRIQKERCSLRESIRGTPLYRAFLRMENQPCAHQRVDVV